MPAPEFLDHSASNIENQLNHKGYPINIDILAKKSKPKPPCLVLLLPIFDIGYLGTVPADI